MVVEILRGDRRLLETFPHKELQDYWGTRPRYEDGTSGGYVPANSTPGASGSGSAHTLAVEESPDELPPPPYTFEGAGGGPEKSASPKHGGFSTAPNSPDDKKDYNVSNLTSDIGKHSLGGPSPQSPSHPHMPGGFDSQPTSPYPPEKSTSPPQSASSSYFPPPTGPSQDIAMPSMPFHVMPGADPHHSGINFNTPFHWDGGYPSPQLPGGFGPSTPTSPWDQQAPGQGPSPAHSPHPGSGYPQQYSYPGQTPSGPPSASLPPQGYGQHQSFYPGMMDTPVHGADRPHPVKSHSGPAPGSPPLSQAGVHGHRQYTYPGVASTQVSDRPPMTNSPPLSPGYGQHQSFYPGMANPPAPVQDHPSPPHPVKSHTGPPPVSDSPPLPQGQYQYSYPGMTSSPAPGPPDRPPMSNSPPLSPGYGQHQSFYPAMANPPAPVQDRPPPPHPVKSHTGPPPVSNSPPLSQGPGGQGQHQYSYPSMTSSPAPGPPDRPPTRPPTSNSPPLSQGYGQHQSSYPGMPNSPGPVPGRPPTSHTSRPTTPHHQSSLPPQQPPPLPMGLNYPQRPTQPAYGGMNPGTPNPPNQPYQPTGSGLHGYQPPQQQNSPYPGYNPPAPGTSSYPGYPESNQPPPPLPPRKCHLCS
jgi:hypothetical protein